MKLLLNLPYILTMFYLAAFILLNGASDGEMGTTVPAAMFLLKFIVMLFLSIVSTVKQGDKKSWLPDLIIIISVLSLMHDFYLGFG